MLRDFRTPSIGRSGRFSGFEQTQVVTRNISRLLKGENVLEDYVPPVPGIRMSLGLVRKPDQGRSRTSPSNR